MEANKRKSGCKCVLKHCAVSKRTQPGTRIFRFPDYDTMFGRFWRDACKIPRETKGNMYLCEKHFTSNCFGNKYLKREAIPSLFLFHPVDVSNSDPRWSSETINEPSIDIKQSPPNSPRPQSVESASQDDDEFKNTPAKISSNHHDGYDAFGAFVASELRGLDSDLTLVRLVKRKIQFAILEGYEKLTAATTVPTYSPSASNVPRPPKFKPPDTIEIKTESPDNDLD